MASLNYRVHGSPSATPLMMLHGFLGSSDEWRQVIVKLQPDVHCITVDLPGHGENRRQSDFGFKETAAALIEILDELSLPRAGLLGYSMGGRIARYTAMTYSQRFSFLIMESASVQAGTPERRRQDVEVAAQLRTIPFHEFLQYWYDQPLFCSLKNHSQFSALLTKRFDNYPEALANALLHLGAGVQPHLPEFDRLPLPFLMLVGELDEKYQSLAQQIQPPSAVVIPGCGHNIHFENPALFSRLVREFINKTI
jgi:2-succinyl-6-hydroxy-2,4-cyclohexadiene-1-carboxylate synthase